MKKQNGITLIALVITVIVLLILAGITINLTIGEDGIIKRAEEAGKNYTQAAEKEKTEIAEFSDLTDKVIDKVTQKYHTMVDGVPVPKGFIHIEGTKETGFVIKDITTKSDGTPTDTNGNEFVWVPCSIDGKNGSIKYDRYAFLSFQPDSGIDTETNSKKIKYGINSENIFTQTMPSDEQLSVQTYGGFYIGRYETGIENYTSVDKNTDASNAQNEYTGYIGGKAVIKSRKQVWNFITRDKAEKVSEELYKKSKGDSVNSKLCSSYAWDTALKFIETKNVGYASNGVGGNYKDKTFNYIDLEGGAQTKDVDVPTLIPTGQTVAANNIYDMGGNVYEWTNENCSNEINSCTARGGYYNFNQSDSQPAKRGNSSKFVIREFIGFRTTLYL